MRGAVLYGHKHSFSTLLLVSMLLAFDLTSATDRCTGNENSSRECSESQVNKMKIRIIIGDTTLSATLADNPTAREFASLLPLTSS
jgi:hypothetical protein